MKTRCLRLDAGTERQKAKAREGTPRRDRKYAQLVESGRDSPLRGACDDGNKRDRVNAKVPPPRVFCEKSLEVADLIGVDFFGSAEEFARV